MKKMRGNGKPGGGRKVGYSGQFIIALPEGGGIPCLADYDNKMMWTK